MQRGNWFIAFPVPLEQLVLPVAPRCVRTFSPSDRHLTIAFLGAVEHMQAEQAWLVARGLNWHGVNLSLGEMRALGARRRPGALSAEVNRGREDLESMLAQRGAIFAALGVEPPKQTPLAHITLARVKRKASREEYADARSWMHSLTVAGTRGAVDRMALYTWSEDRQETLFQIVHEAPIAKLSESIQG